MGTSGFILIMVGMVIVFRVLIHQFCQQAEFKKRLGYAAGMMLCYTIILVLLLYIESTLVDIQTSAAEFGMYMSAVVFAMNMVFIFVITIYLSVAKKRSLSNREKIKLKDL